MKRILAMLLAVVMVLGLAPMAFAAAECEWGEDCPAKAFTDVPADAWYHDDVEFMVAIEIMNGISATEFAPEAGMTRGMAATVIWRVFDEPVAEEAASFTDVAADAWYADAVAWMEGVGLMEGVGNGLFAPEAMMTREQIATVMYRIMQTGGAYIVLEADLADFEDGDEVSAWAEEAMIWAITEGIIKGDDKGNLNPTDDVKRAECAAIVGRTYTVDVIFPDVVVDNKEDLLDAIAEGGHIVVENDVAFSGSEVTEISEDTTLYLMGDLDASEHTSRPFNVAEDTRLVIQGGDNTVSMGKYGLINIPSGDGVYIELNGGNYEGATDYGSFIKPRGEGEMSIKLYDVNVTDNSDNGGWLIDATSHSGDLSVYITGGTYKGYNGITSAEYIEVESADMTFKANGIQSLKEAYVNNTTIKVTKENTATEQVKGPSAAIIAYSNGYISVTNSTLDCVGDAMAVYTTGGTIEAVAVTIENGTISEYHPRNHYPDAEFLITVDGEIPATLKVPNCEGKEPCDDCTTFVNSEEDLRAAVAAGGKVALTDDVEVDADTSMTIASGKVVDLYLNGNTLSGETDNAGSSNREVFMVKGEMNVYNGTVTMEHTGDNMGWGGMTTVANITAGGVMNVEDVTLENLGGTSMNFAVHLNNWGEVTLNAKNSTIKAAYIAIRVFNGGYDMNNVSLYDCVLHGDVQALWVHNYIGDLNSTQHPDDAINDRLNIDLCNGTNEITNGTVENPKNNPILLGFSNYVYYDAEGNLLANE